MDELALLTSGEVADLLQVSERQLSLWRAEGGGPQWLQLGSKTIRYRRTDVTKWLDETTKDAPSADTLGS